MRGDCKTPRPNISMAPLRAQIRMVDRGVVKVSTSRPPGVLEETFFRFELCGPWDLAMPGQINGRSPD